MNRKEFDGAYIEVENGEVRYYCRSRLDGVRTALRIESKGLDSVCVTVYDGVSDIEEMSQPDAELMTMALNDPKVQMVMSMFGAKLVGVSRLPPGET